MSGDGTKAGQLEGEGSNGNTDFPEDTVKLRDVACGDDSGGSEHSDSHYLDPNSEWDDNSEGCGAGVESKPSITKMCLDSQGVQHSRKSGKTSGTKNSLKELSEKDEINTWEACTDLSGGAAGEISPSQTLPVSEVVDKGQRNAGESEKGKQSPSDVATLSSQQKMPEPEDNAADNVEQEVAGDDEAKTAASVTPAMPEKTTPATDPKEPGAADMVMAEAASSENPNVPAAQDPRNKQKPKRCASSYSYDQSVDMGVAARHQSLRAFINKNPL